MLYIMPFQSATPDVILNLRLALGHTLTEQYHDNHQLPQDLQNPIAVFHACWQVGMTHMMQDNKHCS